MAAAAERIRDDGDLSMLGAGGAVNDWLGAQSFSSSCREPAAGVDVDRLGLAGVVGSGGEPERAEDPAARLLAVLDLRSSIDASRWSGGGQDANR